MYKIYILHEDLFNTIDIFTSRDNLYFIQYKIKWQDKLEMKRWTLDELVGVYPYWEETKTVTLHEKEIQLF